MKPEPKPKWYEDGLNFTCQQCGNCCTGPPGYVWVTDQEVADIAEHLGVDEQTFRSTYAHRDLGRWTLNEVASDHGYDCVFLRRDPQGKGLCSIYQVRPVQCRTWPYWPENLKNRRAWRRAARHCEGMAAGLEGRGEHYPIEKIRILRDSTPDI